MFKCPPASSQNKEQQCKKQNEPTLSQSGTWMVHLSRFLKETASHRGTLIGRCGRNGPTCSFVSARQAERERGNKNKKNQKEGKSEQRRKRARGQGGPEQRQVRNNQPHPQRFPPPLSFGGFFFAMQTHLHTHIHTHTFTPHYLQEQKHASLKVWGDGDGCVLGNKLHFSRRQKAQWILHCLLL